MAKRRFGGKRKYSKRRKLGTVPVFPRYGGWGADMRLVLRKNLKRRAPFLPGAGGPTRVVRRNTGPLPRGQPRPRTRGAAFGPLTARTLVAGRRRPMTVKKMLRVGMTGGTLRFQGVNRMNSLAPVGVASDGGVNLTCPGFFRLRNTSTNATEPDRAYLPFHVIELTHLPNISQDSGSVLRQMALTNAGGVVFDAIDGQRAVTGAAYTHWNWEYTDNPTSSDSGTGIINNALGCKYVKTEWYDIRFLLYGMRQQPTFFDIMLVRFDRDHLVPNSALSRNAEELIDYNSFYQGMTKNIAFNPILPGHVNFKRGMRVIKRYRKYIAPVETDKADRNPDSHQFRLFYKDGMIRNYDWATKGHNSSDDHDSANFVQQVRAVDLRNECYPRSRLYVLIRALNTTNINPGSGVAEDVDNTPSYDVLVRKKIRYDRPNIS